MTKKLFVALAALCLPCAAQVWTAPVDPPENVYGLQINIQPDCSKLSGFVGSTTAKHRAEVLITIGDRNTEMTCHQFEMLVFEGVKVIEALDKQNEDYRARLIKVRKLACAIKRKLGDTDDMKDCVGVGPP